MSWPTIKDLISRIPPSLGTYAPVLDEIEEALNSSVCSLATVSEAIERDPDLTARLLRLGNSSFFGFPSRLATVNEAISLIGIQQVKDLIVASSVIGQFKGVPGDLVNIKSFWQHSLACGIGARILATERRLPNADKFFVAGLLHDLGRLVLFAEAPEAAQEVFRVYHQEPLLLHEAEVRVLGYGHEEIGQALLRHWQYPPDLTQAVARHHHPSGGGGATPEAAVVHISDHLVNAMELGSSGERHVPPLQAEAWKALRCSTDILSVVAKAIDEQIETVQEAFLSVAAATGKS